MVHTPHRPALATSPPDRAAPAVEHGTKPSKVEPADITAPREHRSTQQADLGLG